MLRELRIYPTTFANLVEYKNSVVWGTDARWGGRIKEKYSTGYRKKSVPGNSSFPGFDVYLGCGYVSWGVGEQVRGCNHVVSPSHHDSQTWKGPKGSKAYHGRAVIGP